MKLQSRSYSRQNEGDGENRENRPQAPDRTRSAGPAETSRNKERDRCILLLSFRHGCRVSEVSALPLDHIDIERRGLRLKRLKRGLSIAHPLNPDELRAANA